MQELKCESLQFICLCYRVFSCFGCVYVCQTGARVQSSCWAVAAAGWNKKIQLAPGAHSALLRYVPLAVCHIHTHTHTHYPETTQLTLLIVKNTHMHSVTIRHTSFSVHFLTLCCPVEAGATDFAATTRVSGRHHHQAEWCQPVL